MPIYMNYDGIKGSVTSGKYKGWIELQSMQFGGHGNANSATANGERRADMPNISEIVVTKQQDNSTTDLFYQAVQSAGKKVIIDLVKDPGQALYLRIEIEGTMISNYTSSGSGGDSKAVPMESLSLNFIKINFNYTASAPMPKTK